MKKLTFAFLSILFALQAYSQSNVTPVRSIQGNKELCPDINGDGVEDITGKRIGSTPVIALSEKGKFNTVEISF